MMSDRPNIIDKLMANFAEHQWESICKCWYLASKEERKIRLQAVMELSVELAKICEIDKFCTGLGGGVIEDVIQGNWRRAAQAADDFTFKDERKEIREISAPIWEKFVWIAKTAAEQGSKLQVGISPPSKN